MKDKMVEEEELSPDARLLFMFGSSWKILEEFFKDLKSIIVKQVKDKSKEHKKLVMDLFNSTKDNAMNEIWIELTELEESIEEFQERNSSLSSAGGYVTYDDEDLLYGARYGMGIRYAKKKLSEDVKVIHLPLSKHKGGKDGK